jgi:signal transduction histidine kinase
MPETNRIRAAVRRRSVDSMISIAWGIVVAVASYATVRTIAFFVYPDPNPAALVWSAHAGYFWRLWTVVYAGGIGSFVAYPLIRTRHAAAARALAPALVVAAALLVLQAALFP